MENKEESFEWEKKFELLWNTPSAKASIRDMFEFSIQKAIEAERARLKDEALKQYGLGQQEGIAFEREKVRKDVGMLRQWLNEDRITLPENMVSDEEILSWFAPTSLNPKKE